MRLAALSAKACMAMGLAMVAAAALALVATPTLQTVTNAPNLATTVPLFFGDWQVAKDAAAQVSVALQGETRYEQPYDQTVIRTYVNRQGDVVMLALAWGERQRQDIKVHRPEVCYPAQGQPVQQLQPAAPLQLTGRDEPVPTMSMLAGKGAQLEAVRYWIRLGDRYESDGIGARWYILKEGLQGRIPDGMLVRASQRVHSAAEVPRANAVMERFLLDLTAAVPAPTRAMLVR